MLLPRDYYRKSRTWSRAQLLAWVTAGVAASAMGEMFASDWWIKNQDGSNRGIANDGPGNCAGKR